VRDIFARYDISISRCYALPRGARAFHARSRVSFFARRALAAPPQKARRQ